MESVKDYYEATRKLLDEIEAEKEDIRRQLENIQNSVLSLKAHLNGLNDASALIERYLVNGK